LFAGLLAAAAMAMSTASMAQFDGLYIGGGFTRFKASETVDNLLNTGVAGTLGVSDHQGGFNGNVGFAFSVQMLSFGVEASYANQIGKVTVQAGGTDRSDSVEEAGAVSFLPGLKLGTGALIYGRVGAAQAKLKSDTFNSSLTYKGMLYGLGMKGAVAKNLALVVEYQNYVLKEKEGAKPEAVGVMLGAQYTFW
jgi:opacity protein-like surface antigen